MVEPTPVVIVGAGGFGREVLDVLRAMDSGATQFRFLGFLDDGNPDGEVLARIGAVWLGPTELLADLDAVYVIGIGSPAVRRAIDASASAWGREPATLVHPSATLGGDVELGEGTLICSHVSITTHVHIGRHVHLNLNCTVGHDVRIADFVTVNPGVNISGNVSLDEGVTLGTGSAVIQGLHVGRDTTVGAGASVVRDLPAGVTAVGVPARPLGR